MKVSRLGRVALASVSVMALLSGSTSARADAMSDLIAAAKKEGELTIIAVPHDWCGYGAVIEDFKKKYGLKLNELDPNAGSGDEIEAMSASRSAHPPRRKACCSPTRSPPGTASRSTRRIRKAIGTATIMAC